MRIKFFTISKKIQLIIFFYFLFSIFCFLNQVKAAAAPQIYFQTPKENYNLGDEITVAIFINSVEPVNALQVELGFSANTLDFESFNTNDSIVELWRASPILLGGGIARLEGGIPKSFSGKNGEVAKLIFKAKEGGAAELFFRTANIYAADGLGTLLETQVLPLHIAVFDTASQNLNLEDKTPPNIVDLEVTKTPIEGQKIVVFKAEDKESGLKMALIRTRSWLTWSKWQIAFNPVGLTAGVWSFQFEAVDNQGNSAFRTVYVPEAITRKAIYGILLFGLFYGIYQIYFKNSRRHKKLL